MANNAAAAAGPASARPEKRSFTIAGHRTSISLEAAFWEALREAAEQERTSLAGLVQRIDEQRGGAGLSSAVRVWLLARARRGAGSGQPPS
jgi:predicted DNA-binding ribbon-helix-helix protein